MAFNAQKTPLVRTLNSWALRKVLDVAQILGKALPCAVTEVNGSIVTVKFEIISGLTLPQVTCPIFGPEYIRYPIQIGCLGVVFPASVYIGGVSGLGGGIADLSIPANLSALVFFPVGNANWSPTDDPNAVVIYGPNGGILRTTDKTNTLTVNESGITLASNETATITAPTVTINSAVTINGSITVNP